MESLKSLIAKYFPEEKIQEEKKEVLNYIRYLLPLFWSKILWLKAVEMIETDKKLYFDLRKSSFYITLIYQLFILLLLTILYFIPSISNILANSEIGWLILFCVVLMVGTINLVASRGLINVFVIKKDWIDKSEVKDKVVEISGKRPMGENDNLAFFVAMNRKNDLSFIDRIYSKKQLIPADFKIKYRAPVG